jgi:hypothetical protein
MKRLLMIILILAALLISGCMESQDKPEKSIDELKTLSLSAADNLTGYSLQSTMTRVRTLNAAGENATSENATTITESAETTAIVSLVEHKAHAKGSTAIEAKQPGLDSNTTTTKADVYQMGNSTYIMDESGNWTHLQDPRTTEEIWGGGNNNQVKAMAETFNLSPVEMAGSEKIDDTDAYKLRIITGESDDEALYNTAFNLAANMVSYPMFMPQIDRAELNETGKIEKSIWISKSTYLPVKYHSLMSFTVTPSIVGALDINTSQMTMFNESIGMGAIDVRIETSDVYYDFDKQVGIAPPAEALEAPVIRPIQIRAENSSQG